MCVDIIYRLEKYVNLGLLKTTTHLCTFDITDLYTMLPQEESIITLKKFLHFNHSHVQGMTIEAIENLARIVLSENVFIYENKYYRQVIGGRTPYTLVTQPSAPNVTEENVRSRTVIPLDLPFACPHSIRQRLIEDGPTCPILHDACTCRADHVPLIHNLEFDTFIQLTSHLFL